MLIACCVLVAALLAGWLVPTTRVRTINALLWVGVRVRPHDLAATQRIVDRWLPSGCVLIAGDSFAAMMPARWVDPRAVDFGLGGAEVRHVRTQLARLQSLKFARAIVLFAGSNDVLHRALADAEADLRALLAELPSGLPVLLCTVPPVNPAEHRERTPDAIARLNERWAACAPARPKTHLVRVETVLVDGAGRVRTELFQSDGLHLNAAGNRQVADLLRDALQKWAP